MEIKLTHIRLLVEDYAACFRFYRDVLGFKPCWGDENSGYADFETGTAIVALFGREAMAKAIGKADLPPCVKGYLGGGPITASSLRPR